jgi:hypothetical protein
MFAAMKLKPSDLDSNGYVHVFIGNRKEPFYVFPGEQLVITVKEVVKKDEQSNGEPYAPTPN